MIYCINSAYSSVVQFVKQVNQCAILKGDTGGDRELRLKGHTR